MTDLSSLTNKVLENKIKSDLKQSQSPHNIDDIADSIYGDNGSTKILSDKLSESDKAFDSEVYGDNSSGRKEVVKEQDNYLSTVWKSLGGRSDLFLNQQHTSKEQPKGWLKERPENPLATSSNSKYDTSKDNVVQWPSELPSSLNTAGLDAASNTLLLKIRATSDDISKPDIEKYNELFNLNDLVNAQDFCAIYDNANAPPLGILIRKVDIPMLQLGTRQATYAKKSVVIPTKRITTENVVSLTLYDDMFGSTAKALVLTDGYNFLGDEATNRKFLFQENAPDGLSPSYENDRWIKNTKDLTADKRDRIENSAQEHKNLEAVLYTIYFEHHYALNKEKIRKISNTPYVYPMMRFKNVKFVNFSEPFETENEAKEKTFSCKMIFESKELLFN